MSRDDNAFLGTKRFQIKRELGAGGMGVVYEAYDHEKKVAVALKTLRYVDAKGLERFRREFRALEGFAHPNVVSLGELLEENGKWFFTMELIEGCDFLSYVWLPRARVSAAPFASDGLGSSQADAPAVTPQHVDDTRLRKSLRELSRGLLALHDRGLVHRDIKPTNILVTPGGRTVLMDFGLVTEAAVTHQSTAARVVGTAAYMAPEQARGDKVRDAADWYSVGVLLYEALTGRLPFEGSSMHVMMDKLQYEAPPPRMHVPDVAPDLDELCVDLLRREPEKRPSPAAIARRLGIDDVEISALRGPSTHLTQSAHFVGRESELAQLDQAFDSVADRPVFVFVEGESGMGKTALVEHFAASKSEDGQSAVVLTGRCYEREQVPYKAFDGVAESLTRILARMRREDVAGVMPLHVGLLPLLFPVLKRVERVARAPIVALLPDAQAQRTRMFGAFREVLQRLSQRRRLIIILEDLQWTCADSLTLFEEVFGHEDAPQALILATLRPIDQAKRAAISRAIPTREATRTITVNSLPVTDTRKLATLLMPGRSSADIQALIHETRGHPLFVHELAHHSQASERGMSLDAALQARMSALSAPAASLLTVLCIAGRPITQEVASLAARLDGTEFAKATSVLRVAHLARTDGSQTSDTIGPYHDRVREARIAALDEAERVATHDALAAALEQTGGDPRTIVRHARAAGQLARAAANAEVAASKASAMMAFDQAAEFYQTALALGSYDDATTRALRLKLAAAFADAGRGPEAAQTYAAASEGAEPAVRRDCQRQAAEQWLITGRIDEGLDMIGSALEEIGESVLSTPKRALAALLWRRLHLSVRGLGWKERAESDLRRSDQARLEVLGATASGLSMVDNIRGTAFGTRYLRVALEAGDPRQLAVALVLEAGFLASQGNQKRASRLLRQVEQLFTDHPDERWFAAAVDAARGITLYFAGRFGASDLSLARAQQQFEQVAGTTFWRNNMKVFRVFCLRHLGEIKKLSALVGTLCRDAQRRGDLYLETTVHRYASRYPLLARDRAAEAEAELERCAWPAPEGAYHVQSWFELEARCEIALYAGVPILATAQAHRGFVELERSLLLRAQPIRVLSRSLRGRLLLAASPDRAQLGETARIVRQLERERVGYAQVQAHLLAAAVANLRSQSEVVVAQLRQAVQTAAENQMAFQLAAARRKLGQVLGGEEGAALLTESDAWMTKEGVVDPERMCEVVAPGLSMK